MKKDLGILRDIWYKKADYKTTASSLMERLDPEDKDKIKDLMKIADYCKDMAALI